MQKMALVEPVRVSPFIKFCRWSLLLTGVFYGASRYQSLSKKQKARRDEYEKSRPAREAKMKADKEKRIADELEMISKEIGSKI